jgi:hypothetical protein
VRTRFLIHVWCLSTISALAWAQNDTALYRTDLNGHRVEEEAFDTSLVPDGHATRELSRSVNGRTVPLEKTEQTVIKSGNKTTTETLIKRYNPTGELIMTQKVVTEKETQANGSSTETAKSYTSDYSGTLKEVERRKVETTVQGAVTTKQTEVDQPGLDGSFQVAEKRSSESQKSGDRTDTKETVYRRSQNGEMSPALQEVVSETKSGATTTRQVANYEPGLTFGTMRLASQTVSTTTKDKDGNESSEVNIYASAADGHVQENGAPQQIKEQQLITRRVGSDGAVTDSVSVRRPTISDATKLGNPQQISQTTCTGKCITP